MSPSWRLEIQFGEARRIPGPLLNSDACPCRYCWCGACGVERDQKSVLRELVGNLPVNMADLLLEILLDKQASVTGPSTSILTSQSATDVKPSPTVKLSSENISNSSNKVNLPSTTPVADLRIQTNPSNPSNANSETQPKPTSAVPLMKPTSKLDKPQPSTLQNSGWDIKLENENFETDSIGQVRSETRQQSQEIAKDSVLADNEPANKTESTIFEASFSKNTSTNQSYRQMLRPPKRAKLADLEKESGASAETQLENGSPPETPVQKPPKSTRRFHCLECEQVFDERKSFDSHLKSHNDDQPYKCQLCELRFETRQKRTEHFAVHKDASGRLICSQCHKTFASLQSILLHELIHIFYSGIRKLEGTQ